MKQLAKFRWHLRLPLATLILVCFCVWWCLNQIDRDGSTWNWLDKTILVWFIMCLKVTLNDKSIAIHLPLISLQYFSYGYYIWAFHIADIQQTTCPLWIWARISQFFGKVFEHDNWILFIVQYSCMYIIQTYENRYNCIEIFVFNQCAT